MALGRLFVVLTVARVGTGRSQVMVLDRLLVMGLLVFVGKWVWVVERSRLEMLGRRWIPIG